MYENRPKSLTIQQMSTCQIAKQSKKRLSLSKTSKKNRFIFDETKKKFDQKTFKKRKRNENVNKNENDRFNAIFEFKTFEKKNLVILNVIS